MKEFVQQEKLDISYSTDATIINSPSFPDGCCVHLLCHDGNGSFTYGERMFEFGKNDLLILSRSDLLTGFHVSDDFRMECLVAPLRFLYNQLPANHYGIGGRISLWNNPVVQLTAEDVKIISDDFRRLYERIGLTDRLFYKEMIGSLALTMVYDLFEAHARRGDKEVSSDRKGDLIAELTYLLSSGRTKQNRDVTYYASLLNVSPKYLGNVVSRQTGRSVSFLIGQHTMPLIIEYLKNSRMSLTQIADAFNFKSLSYFCRYVQRHLGMSPSEYRASLQPKEKGYKNR